MSTLMKEIYLQCAHCGVEFLASPSQRSRYRKEGKKLRYTCSSICKTALSMAGERYQKGTAPIFQGQCPTCKCSFESKRRKIYCSMKCYIGTEEFKERLRGQADYARKRAILIRTGKEEQESVFISCLHCGKEKALKPSRGSEKFCSRTCYRKYMTERFDRWIASPQSIALPQAYDEFLTQEYLPCLIEGCEWTGLNLGQHLNFTHGITAREFKRAAGFNLGTGLCTPATSKMLSERPHLALFDGSHFKYDTPPLTRNYSSLEGKEHFAKSIALNKGKIMGQLTCLECGKIDNIIYGAFSKRFCSVRCREKSRTKNRKINSPHNCYECSSSFIPSYYQNLRILKGYKVFCNTHCRQKNNGRFSRKK